VSALDVRGDILKYVGTIGRYLTRRDTGHSYVEVKAGNGMNDLSASWAVI
jgi:hypothetical protein